MTGTALINYEERFARDAADLAAREARSSASISTQGGVFSLGGQSLGTKMLVVILDSYFENVFYTPGIPYDSANRENNLPPICYAFNRDKKSMGPDPSMQSDLTWFKPQHHVCEGCPKNEWSSSERGKGKACGNRERLYVVPAGFYTPATRQKVAEMQLIDDPEHYATASSVALSVPPTSLESWATYVTSLAASQRRPPYAVVTEVLIEPNPKGGFKLKFEFVELCPDTLFEILIRRVEAQVALPFIGYQAPEQERRNPAPQQRSASGLRRGFR